MKKNYEICINLFNIFVDVTWYGDECVYFFKGIKIVVHLIENNEIFEVDITDDIECLLDSEIEYLNENNYELFISNPVLYDSEKKKYLVRVKEYLNNYDIQSLINQKSKYFDYRNITQNYKSIKKLLKN